MRRKTYLLLELLIAFTLLSLSALPLVRNPMHAAKEEIAAFERMELERLAELSYAAILEKLYCNEIPWKTFDPRKIPLTPTYQEKLILTLPDFFKKNYDKKIFLWTRGEKKGPENEKVRLIGIKIVFAPVGKAKKSERAFNYRALIEQKSTSSKTKEVSKKIPLEKNEGD